MCLQQFTSPEWRKTEQSDGRVEIVLEANKNKKISEALQRLIG